MLQRSPCLNSCWLRCDGACAAKNGLTIYSAANIVFSVNPNRCDYADADYTREVQY